MNSGHHVTSFFEIWYSDSGDYEQNRLLGSDTVQSGTCEDILEEADECSLSFWNGGLQNLAHTKRMSMG